MKRISSYFALACAALAAAAAAHAQSWPAKPVRLVVPFAAGGSTDIVARTIAQKLNEAWGQSVVVDNRAGGSTVIGTDIVAKAPPDGYTILVTPAPFTIVPSLMRKLPYNPHTDFEPITLVNTTPLVVVVHPGVPAHNVKELIALAKQKPGALFFASTGNGGTPHLAMEMFKLQTHVNLVHVPYKGTPPAVTDLLAGQVQLMFANTLSVLPMVKSGRLRAIAISSAKRSAATPDIPTVAESGVPGFEAVTWFGMLAPTGTPQPIIERLNAEITKAVMSREVHDRLIAQGADPITMTVPQFTAFFHAELAKWAKTVKAAGVTIQ